MIKKLLIAIPNFNNSKYIKESIISANKQTNYCNEFKISIDIVVFDNASTDNSLEKISEIKLDNLSVVKNKNNVGAIANHNKCIDYAIFHNYDYLKILSSDDVLLDDILISQAKILYREKVAFVTCDMIVTDENLNNINSYQFYQGDYYGRCDYLLIKRICFEKFDNLIGGPSNLLIDVASIGKVRYPERYKWVSDLAFALNLLNRGYYYNIRKPGFCYRRHENTDSLKLKSKYLRTREFIFLMIEYRQFKWLLARCVKFFKSKFNKYA